MRAQALVLATLFLLTPLAGCLGGAEATAQDLLPTARRLASAWHPDAALEGLLAVELRELPPGMQAAIDEAGNKSQDPQLALLQYRDPDVGDGRAGAWLFVFDSADGQLVLALDSSGKELLRHEDQGSGGRDAPALTDPAIDSDRASDLAAAANQTFHDLRGNAVAATFALAQTERGPMWVAVLAESFASKKAVFVAVDATTGNVTAMDGSGFGGLGGFGGSTPEGPSAVGPESYYRPYANRTLTAESGSDSGTLSVAGQDHSSTFEVKEAGHRELRVTLDLPRALPPTKVTATIESPQGRKATAEYTSGLTPQASVAVLDIPEAGEYKVTVHLDTGILQSYDLAWCAPGDDLACSTS